MNRITACFGAIVVALAGASAALAFTADTPKADAVDAKATTTAVAADDQELKLPPGWKKTKRGKYILYCKDEAPMGTRLKSKTCYDELNMRNYILALEQTKSDVDRIRATCSNICVCGSPESC
jgi:hypothetical protein